jgi:hypothetical protein
MKKGRPWWVAAAVAALAQAVPVAAQPTACAADPQAAAARFNYALGTQAFGDGQRDTTAVSLLAQAKAIRGMGSNLLKIGLGRRQAIKHGFGRAARGARTTLEFVKAAPELQRVLDLDFTYYQFWVQGFAAGDWHDGVSPQEARAYYDEMYEFTAWLLKRYAGTGKLFMLGNWEGDWLLNGRQGKGVTPTPEAVAGMTLWLNIRQKAVDDAKAAIPHAGVDVLHYVEVNLVKRGMEGQPSVASSVLPATNVDLVSYSSYEAIKQSKLPDLNSIRTPLTRITAYLEGQLKPKAGLPFARRVFIGEYGYHANRAQPETVEQQFLKSRFVMQVALELDLPFALIWQLYNNEVSADGTSANMGLLEDSGEKRALYYLHQQYLASMAGFVADSCRRSGHLPTPAAVRAQALATLATLSFEKMQQLVQARP